MSTSTLSAKTLSGLDLGRPRHAASFCKLVHVSVLLYLEGTVSLVSLSPLPLTLFLPPLSHNSLNPEGSILMKVSHLGLSVPRFRTLCIIVPISCRRKLLWLELTYEYCRMSLNVFLLLCPFGRTIVFVFFQVYDLSNLRFLATPTKSGMGSIS